MYEQQIALKIDKGNLPLKKPLTKFSNLFPVVGIGANAGGLDAFKKLLKAVPENSGMAYVLGFYQYYQSCVASHKPKIIHHF